MKVIRYISYFLSVMAISSCSAMDFENEDYLPSDDGPGLFINGIVYDSEDNHIEHIRVTLDWNNGNEKAVKYTASDGSFTAELPRESYHEGMSITITLDDIDGDANGGQFNSLTDNIVYGSGDKPIETLIYRLNRATPSENSPRP